jgi:DNA-binding GntR family transcriptional regulator
MDLGNFDAPARHKTAKDFVVDAVTQALSEGRMKPGDRLNEKELSEWLQVSRTPVREALNILERDGLVQLIPHRGAVVRTITADEIRDEYTLRAALESMAVELAVPKVPDQVVRELRTLVENMHRPGGDDVHDYLDMNKELHLRLYQFSGNRRLTSLIESSWDRENYFRRFYFQLSDGPDHEERMHMALVEACERRDAVAARDLVKNSLLEAAELLALQFEASYATPQGNASEHPTKPQGVNDE